MGSAGNNTLGRGSGDVKVRVLEEWVVEGQKMWMEERVITVVLSGGEISVSLPTYLGS